jgi:POLQ-like helicase
MIFDRLASDILKEDYFKFLFTKLSKQFGQEIIIGASKEEISERELRHLLRFSDILSNSSSSIHRNLSYKIVSLLNTLFSENPVYRTYSTAILSKIGNFPAINFLNYDIELPFDRRIEANAKKEVQKVGWALNTYFTDSQFELFKRLKDTNYYSFAGPTSMGKSFIIKAFIREIISKSQNDNMVIVVPTRALISQFVFDLTKELGNELKQNRYNILSNYDESAIKPGKNYIFILTPERLLSLLSEKARPTIDILFVDEAHKLAAEDDYRSLTLYLAVEKTMKFFNNIKVYFSAPNVSNPEVFLKLFNLNEENVYKTDEAPVGQNLFFLDLLEKECIYFTEAEAINFSLIHKSYNSTMSTIYNLGKDSSNIIYTNSIDMTVSYAMEFSKFFIGRESNLSKEEKAEIDNTIETIKEIIHPQFFLIDCIKLGIGFHFGRLPHIVRQKVEKLFKKGIIKYLFCTSTLLEGVNLPAKNVFILKNKKGLSKISKIDFWNLAGRAGRLNSELSGNIFCIREGIRDWTKQDLFKKDNIRLKASIDSKLDKRFNKIEQIIRNEDVVNISNKENEILSYIANIIYIDRLDDDKEYKSPVISRLINEEKYDLLSLIDKKKEDIKAPFEVIQKSYSLMVQQQNNVYNFVNEQNEANKGVLLPEKVNYNNCLFILKLFYKIYEWKKYEKVLENEKTLNYYAQLMNNWINGVSLKSLIVNTLQFKEDNKKDVYFNRNGKRIKETFNIKNTFHVNLEINSLLKDIEYVLQYVIEMYFENYYSILEYFFEAEAGVNWATYLEFGTKNPIIISLQNQGFSRQTAIYIYNHCFDSLIIENNKLINVNKSRLLNYIDYSSVYYDEVTTILNL